MDGGLDLQRLDNEAFVCETCGVQHGWCTSPPSECSICTDARQFVSPAGQQWLTHGELKRSGMRSTWDKLEPGLYGITTNPKVGIGQRALLVRTPQGNVLWDCLSVLDDATIDVVKAFGGLRAIAISHPHFYASNAQWSATFGGVPVYIHQKDEQWVKFRHENVHLWSGDSLNLWEGLTVMKLGGHFAGGSILHWANGADGKGVVLGSDIIAVVADRKSVTVMRSFPNYIPLSASKARRIGQTMAKVNFERLYGAFAGLQIVKDAKSIVAESMDRYVHWIQNDDDES